MYGSTFIHPNLDSPVRQDTAGKIKIHIDFAGKAWELESFCQQGRVLIISHHSIYENHTKGIINQGAYGHGASETTILFTILQPNPHGKSYVDGDWVK